MGWREWLSSSHLRPRNRKVARDSQDSQRTSHGGASASSDDPTVLVASDAKHDDETTLITPSAEIANEPTVLSAPDSHPDDELTLITPSAEIANEPTVLSAPDSHSDSELTVLTPSGEIAADNTTPSGPAMLGGVVIPGNDILAAPVTQRQRADGTVSSAGNDILAAPVTQRDGESPLRKTSADKTRPTGPDVLEDVVIPGYDILQELGRGGMGVVYKARHRQLQRVVALKMILAGAYAGTAAVARFRLEAKAVARLQHANIVQLYETGEHEGRPFFSLEFVDGGSLEERVKELPPPPQGAAHLLESLARAMEFAHQHGIVHRDLKPANILLASIGGQSTTIRKEPISTPKLSGGDHWSQSCVPKITDFGLAKEIDDNSPGQTHTGTILGTPNYMSPEQASGKVHEIGPGSDVYSLGAIFYKLLTGRPPFKASNPIDLIHQVIGQEPVPPRQLEPRVPLDLETICLKCLQKEANRRYLTAGELADDLHRFLHHEPILARPISTSERVWKWGKRRPMVVAGLAVSVAAVVSMVLFVIWHNVDLRVQVDQALAKLRIEEKQKQDAIEQKQDAEKQKREALEKQRLSQVQNEGRKLFDGAQVAFAQGNLPKAQLELNKVLTMIRSQPVLGELRQPADTLLKEVEQKLQAEAEKLQAEAGQRDSLARFKKFADLRNEAQFLGSLYTGMDLAANLKASRAAVHSALAVYRVSATQNAPPALDQYLAEPQRTEIHGDCYQLFLILAETEAQSAAELKSPEQEERLREALRLLDQALRFGPHSRAYHLRRARYLSRLDDEAGAAQAEHVAQDTPVKTVLDHFLAADERYRRADLDEAIKEFEQVLQLEPGHFWAMYLNSLCLLRQQHYAEAKTLLTACTAQGREFVWPYLLRGFAHGELKAFDAADADFDKASQMPLDENSRYVLFVNRGVLRIHQKRFDAAIADLNEAIQQKPTAYQAFVNLANAFREHKDWDKALQQLDRAIEHEPSLAQLYRLRARLHVERSEPELALTDFEQAIQRENSDSPFQVDNRFERGRLQLQAGQHKAALESFDAALQLRKEHSLAQRLRAESLFHLGRFQDVIDAFDLYLKIGGKPLESVYRGRGLAKSELGLYPGAIEDFTNALELQPTSAVQAYRGWMHVVCDAPKLAERDFKLAIELDPKNSDAYCGRGFVLALQKNFSESITDAEEALRLGPPSSRLLYNTARIYALSARNRDSRVFELISESLALLPVDQRASFWSSQIRTDAALGAIRRQPRFLQMEKDLLSTK